MKESPEGLCPFAVGDTVVYRPSVRGRGHILMTEMASLEPGRAYRIARIDGDRYVVPEGYENSPGGGLHWTEFRAAA